MPSENHTERRIIYALIAVGLLTFLYSVLIAGRPLFWFSIGFPLVLVYLFWRLVRAVERIADAQEHLTEENGEQIE